MKKHKYMWNFACSVQKEIIFASYSNEGWNVDLFWELQAQGIMARPRRAIHVVRKIESSWQKDGALCLVDPEGRGQLRAVKTWGNG